jgi:hypothetical protein
LRVGVDEASRLLPGSRSAIVKDSARPRGQADKIALLLEFLSSGELPQG